MTQPLPAVSITVSACQLAYVTLSLKNLGERYLSLSLKSSTSLLCFLGLSGSRRCSISPAATFPLLPVCPDASAALSLAGGCEGFSPASVHLLPLETVVLLRRVAGPLVSALSLISAAFHLPDIAGQPALTCVFVPMREVALRAGARAVPSHVPTPPVIMRFIAAAAQEAIVIKVARSVFLTDIPLSSRCRYPLPDWLFHNTTEMHWDLSHRHGFEEETLYRMYMS
ncbi:hypothetical protein EYF80_026012 [Liparis tanakae]|uniref:Uncharacterized protein n=1 Tax=Liparis tanakae TaxID=230148 RepID=A0A4Z2HE37_9TELE|nr:hypothetical protein EYF80_026012 [Liparis tanakae]